MSNGNNELNQKYKIEEILCSKCGDVPEILNIHTDNSKIELKCKTCGIYEIKIDDYYNILSENKFRECKKCRSSKNNLYYCYQCMHNICEKCKKKHDKTHNYIKLNEKKEYCPKDSIKFNYFCKDCELNYCDNESNLHENHEKIPISPLFNEYEKYYRIIEATNKELKKIVEFNQLIKTTGEKYQNNYFHLKSVINLGKSLNEGNKRNSKDIKCLLNGLSNYIENSLEAISNFEKSTNIQLNRDIISLNLNQKSLKDKDFEYLSQIRFNQLIEIDISENEIKSIEPFKAMSLPFLEFLNLSHNHIEKIKPIANIKSKKLQYIFLQNNEIEDIKIFLEDDFPKNPKDLKILRIEDNNINAVNDEERKKTLKLIEKKYKKRFIYESINKQKEDFKKNYNLDKEISGEDEIIDIHDLNCGDEILKDLFLIITYKSKNNINKLVLRNNNIKDPSILNRINFNKLLTLDLAVNEITNLNFLLGMKAKNLKYLYLDNNYFNDIYPLLIAKFPNLETLSLNKNNFDPELLSKSPGYSELYCKENEEGKQIYIQLEEEKKRNKELNDNAKKSKENTSINQNQVNGINVNEVNSKENNSINQSQLNETNHNQ
jgi:Leucine-rich repeat (LRR) protein